VFEADAEAEQFNAFMQEINTVSELEQAIQYNRMHRIGNNLNILNS
jgi:hypothetical protein